jgi:hypothetical protein
VCTSVAALIYLLGLEAGVGGLVVMPLKADSLSDCSSLLG